MQLPLTSPPQSICILRLSALGDVCNCVPTVRAIQRKWPDCRITWIIGKAEGQLLAGLSGVEFIIYDKRSGFKGLWALRKQLGGRRFDVLLHMQQALRASVLSLVIKADMKLGYDPERAKDHQEWFTDTQLPPHPKAHMLESYLDFALAIGADGFPLEWDIPISEDIRQQAASRVQAPYVLISPCSTQRTRNFRNWSVEGYARVIDHIQSQHGMQVVLSGGNTEMEQSFGEEICALTQTPPNNLIGKTGLKELLSLVADAQVVIGPDSGPMHMATATGTPAMGLYASTNPDRASPYLSRQWVVNQYPAQIKKHFDCEVDEVSWGQRVRSPDVMESISSDEVIATFDRLIAAQTAAADATASPQDNPA